LSLPLSLSPLVLAHTLEVQGIHVAIRIRGRGRVPFRRATIRAVVSCQVIAGADPAPTLATFRLTLDGGIALKGMLRLRYRLDRGRHVHLSLLLTTYHQEATDEKDKAFHVD
jgi:hypothetical protein